MAEARTSEIELASFREEQGKLTDELRGAIETAATKQSVEDIYLPYKPKRCTRAQSAREAGLEPLADALFADPTLDPEQEGAKYVNVKPGTDVRMRSTFRTRKLRSKVPRDILVERFAEMSVITESVTMICRWQSQGDVYSVCVL